MSDQTPQQEPTFWQSIDQWQQDHAIPEAAIDQLALILEQDGHPSAV